MCAVIAIHDAADFPSRWYEYGVACGHEVRKVNGYDSEIQSILRGCQAFLWQLNHEENADLLFARSILMAVESQGIRVFPNHMTGLHFDDKVAQKYLLEAANAPIAQTWVFYSESDAMQFLEGAPYPLVFKLRRGAGSMNVRLVRKRSEGTALAKRMFGRGISPFTTLGLLRQVASRARTTHSQRDPLRLRLSRVVRRTLRRSLRATRERGYVLFQRFVPDNDHDLRVTVIGDRAFTFRRGVRPNDFRASGSGRISYPSEAELPRDAIGVAFDISRRFNFQSMAFDFARASATGDPVLLEMSFTFQAKAVFECPGYLDSAGVWHAGHWRPEDLILDDLLEVRKERS